MNTLTVGIVEDPWQGNKLAQDLIQGQGAKIFSAAADTVTDVVGTYALVSGAGIAAPLAFDAGMTWAATQQGAAQATQFGAVGVVIGEYLEGFDASYEQVAASVNMNAFNLNQTLYGVLNYFGYGTTANVGLINGAITSGQTIYTSSAPWITGGMGYWMETNLLAQAGVRLIPLAPRVW